MRCRRLKAVLLWGMLLCAGCNVSQDHAVEEITSQQKLFEEIPASRSSIEFSNTLVHTERVNTYTYRNFYNGAGVAAGDINNDGLVDLYFAGNQTDNKLYLNKGNFIFEDITEKAGLACSDVWSTGVSMADINGDGWLDIYVCKSGPPDAPNRNNELFINNGDLTFTERSAEYGLADKGLSNHAAFFDYDRDGDLDMYLLNNSLRSIGIYDLREGQREIRDPEGGNKLYRNDGDHFTDVSEEAGIYGSAIGFGLGVTVADINKDLWPDIFVSNDFFERDYLYINNGDGTFTERLEEDINEISMGSMGADIADLNNDTWPDIYVSEMLPASLERVKTKTLFEDWDKYTSDIRNGYYHQFTRNAFQLNNGPVPGENGRVSFSEISRMTGTEATDWSWGALLFDADNDGNRDIFVANGIYKDLTDQDYVNFYSNNEILISRHKKDSTLLTTLIDKIPSVPIHNYLFLNRGGLQFEDVAVSAGLDFRGFSNGAVYADLDNDGRLDLVLNNINDTVKVYRNVAPQKSFLSLKLRGSGANTAAFGTQVYAYNGTDVVYAEQYPVKGYMSSMDHRLHLGLGDAESLDSLIVMWPDGKVQRMYDVAANQQLELIYTSEPLTIPNSSVPNSSPFLKQINVPGLDTVSHQENEFNDFNRDRLLYEMYSNEGPPAAVADLNGDGTDDVVLGGSRGKPVRIFLQTSKGQFIQSVPMAFMNDRESEDSELITFDADGDGDLDIFAASGSNEYGYLDFRLKDRLYINDGAGGFNESESFQGINVPAEPTGFACLMDVNRDGLPDIVAGARQVPFNYGLPGGIYVYLNKDNGDFELSGEVLAGVGMLTDAVVADLDQDGREELIVVGEWMKPISLVWEGGTFVKKNIFDLPSGLYKSVAAADLGNDGRTALIFGNYGTNTRLRASADHPMTWHIADYDDNRQLDHILSIYQGDTLYPLNLLQDLSKQIPAMRKKFQTFNDYRNASTEEVLKGMNRTNETVLYCEELASYAWLNNPDGGKIAPLPYTAQLSPVYAIAGLDLDSDGSTDLLVGGNQRRVKPELGGYNASYGAAIGNDGSGNLKALPQNESGFWVRGEIRRILPLTVNGKPCILVVRNNGRLVIFTREE